MTDSVLKFATTMSLARIRQGDNPRRYFDQKTHDELVASIRLRGIIQPLLIRPVPDAEGEYSIVAGGRRHKAAAEALGHDADVPVLIREMTDQEALEAAIDENDNREDASETEQADAAVRVLAACQGDRAEAARRLAWSPSKLDRRLALANLAEAVKVALDERRIKVGHAELLAAVPGDKQATALETILINSLSVAKTRELLMRVTQSLAGAQFDKAECTTCPFNSASQRALFATHVDDGYCTNPGCFQLKTEAEAALVAKAASKPAKKGDAAKAAPAAEQAPPATPTPAATPSPAGKPVKATTPAQADGKVEATAPAPSKPAVTAESIASRVNMQREAAWRAALIKAVEGDPEFANAFEATLRDTWKVDRFFLSCFNKDELKFIAQECGLVDHMGAKPFARLLDAKMDKIIDGMLNATGFSWAGRLPSAMTLDGKYSPPPAGAGLGVHHAHPDKD
ncbi:chromosome partitioning protein ParB [Sphingobium sp. Leaf26]|uniref:PRTRC system ParB family protein n=1 Tax=Sphingobium sp. Leaf26 TaxID=1735693 RepID=UPI0006F1FBFB|nr:PRTRC system ParB family protein [Sphingobium sp. Leaf26]KQN09845.1 chromosome partitioning protein ParB [Sphingobium sp. Leaf26]